MTLQRCGCAVGDGEIVKLDQSGPIFIDLMKRRGPFAFDEYHLRVGRSRAAEAR